MTWTAKPTPATAIRSANPATRTRRRGPSSRWSGRGSRVLISCHWWGTLIRSARAKRSSRSGIVDPQQLPQALAGAVKTHAHGRWCGPGDLGDLLEGSAGVVVQDDY